MEPGAVYVVAHPSADQAILAKAHELHSSLSNGNDATCLVRGSRDSFLTLDCIGTFDAGPSAGWGACGTEKRNVRLIRLDSRQKLLPMS